MRADGAGDPQRLLDDPRALPYSFSPDGRRLAYTNDQGQNFGIWTLPLDISDPERPKPGKPDLFLMSKFRLLNPSFSPDGKWIAYASAETQPPQIFVRPFSGDAPGTGGKWQISTDGGVYPMWSRDRSELFYVNFTPAGDVRVVSYTIRGDSFVAGQPRNWGRKWQHDVPPYLMPDGKHFITVGVPSEESKPQTHVNFLLNFADELRRRTSPTK
jgi:Tol biopolymer transport system component